MGVQQPFSSPQSIIVSLHLGVECRAEEEAHAGRGVSEGVLVADELQLDAQAQLPPRALERVVQREPALHRM